MPSFEETLEFMNKIIADSMKNDPNPDEIEMRPLTKRQISIMEKKYLNLDG